jgi:hypothetical protein
MELRGQPTGPVPDGGRLLNTVLDNGINFIYTTIDYGRSEKRIGRFLAHCRDDYVLASKSGYVSGAPQDSEHVHTAENIRASHGFSPSLTVVFLLTRLGRCQELSESAATAQTGQICAPDQMTVERLLVAHRRVSARLSRALRVVGCIAVPGYVPADSRTGRIFMYRHARPRPSASAASSVD